MGTSAGGACRPATGLALAALFFCTACTGSKVTDASAQLVATPAAIDFGAAFVGDRAFREVEIRSNGRVPVVLAVRSAPEGFLVEPADAEVGPGGSTRLQVIFAPASTDEFGGTLVLGDGSSQVALEVTGAGVGRQLEAPSELDFGPVVLGEDAVEAVRLVNRSALPVTLEPSVDGANATAFRPAAGPLELPAGATGELDVRFSPSERGPAFATLLLKPCAGCDPLEVELRGTGRLDRVVASPSSLDFGTVLVDTSRALDVVLRNQGDVARTVGAFHLSASGAEFEVDEARLPQTIEPGASAAFSVTFTPRSEGLRTATLQALDEDGEAIVGLPVTGNGQERLIVVEPAVIDFGTQAVGSTATRQVLVSVEGGTIQVTAANLEGAGATFAASALRSLPTTVGDPLELRVTYRPTAAGAHTAVLALATSDPRRPTVRIPLSGAAVLVQPCRLSVRPAELQFGLVTAGTTNRKNVTVTAVGSGECRLTDLAIDGPAGSPFTVAEPVAEIVLAPGASQDLEVTFAPPLDVFAEHEATLQVATAEPTESPALSVPVSGESFAGDLRAIPDPVDFGTVVFARPAFRAVELRNVGAAPLTIRSASMAAGSAPELTIRVAPPWPVTLGPGSGVTLALALTPVANHGLEGVLEIGVEGTTLPKRVDVRGEVIAGECGPSCHAPTAVCPGRVVTEVARQVELEGLGLDPDGDPLTCSWSLASAPVGSTAAIAPPTTACAVDFTADLVGDYQLELTVTDPTGYQGRCVTELHAEPYSGLWIETFWEHPADVDLHLLHPTHHPGIDPFDAWSWGGTDGADCFYATCRPDLPPLSWPDGPGPEDDPSLDVDSQHLGPENIRIDVPNRTHPYWIGVHWLYNPLHHPDLRVTTNVYCGRALAASRTVTLLHREHAVLGKVDVNPDGTCAFTASAVRLSY